MLKMKINVAMIVKNEQGCLEKCLKSLKGFDEIFVVDTGSTDKTLDILEKYKCKISHYKWDGNFSNARNFGLAQIPADEWVFIIDADEWLPNGSIKKIKNSINKRRTNNIFAHVKNVVDGHEHQHLRLFMSGLFYKDAAHNHIPVTDWDWSDILIMHRPSINHEKDPKRTLRILQKIIKPTPRELFLLGREYMNFHKYKNAIEYLEKYIDVAEPNQLTAEALLYIAECKFQLKDNVAARSHCLLAINLSPEYTEALIAMATFCDPQQTLTWLKYAEASNNFGVINLHGKQKERIAEYRKYAVLAINGKLNNNIEK